MQQRNLHFLNNISLNKKNKNKNWKIYKKKSYNFMCDEIV